MFLTSLRARLANIERTQWIGAAVALGAVLFIASLFVVEALYGYWKPEPEIVYVQSWDGDRSYEDALAAQEEERRIADAAETAADQLAAEAVADLGAEDAAGAAEPAIRRGTLGAAAASEDSETE
ncbi:hypothetical protein [Pacificimonas flava]|uniref:Uncharacterized protein n=1 Tax=Pacificimonas flava TaxID=1234595 RepID=M2U2N9_9SPHN|nr:hypothetical protein [Pacificimonas flava]EMD82108.1 hypothetical protein C725_2596 [Pacificimonas flava]MBB5280948.1 hypothetical protein [Pacificimonas flava]